MRFPLPTVAALLAACPIPAADPPKPADLPEPLELTAQEDHKKMMEQLRIKELRRGADGNNPKAANAANADESKATPFPKLPDPLVFDDGTPVTTAADWKRRRAEIVEHFDRDIYGRVPKDVPGVKWEVRETTREKVGEIDVTVKKLVGTVDNSSYPHVKVAIQLTLATPTDAAGPVPVMMEHGFVVPARPGAKPPAPKKDGPKPWTQQLIEKGWGYAIFSPSSVQADTGGRKGKAGPGGGGEYQGLTTGIIGLCNKGQPRKPDDWGALRAWAWGASRCLDYLETDKAVDAKRVGIEGLSRFGKAAVVTLAYDERFAIGLIGSSGQGGAKIMRRDYGERVENVASAGEYHWMAGNYMRYAGPKTPEDLPVDAHEFVALCAPRPVFISVGSENVEGKWIDARGSFLAAAGAGPVYKLLGKKDLGTTEFPTEATALTDGDIAFRQHEGGHTVGPNWPTFLTWADRYVKAPALKAPAKPPVEKEPGHAPADSAAPLARADANSKAARERLVEEAKKGKIDVYFAGDSITRRWGATDHPDFLANGTENVPGWNAADFGWGGDAVRNVPWRLRNGELDNVNPKVIVVLAGPNNLSGARSGHDGAKGDDVTAGLKAIPATCREEGPEAVILLVGVTPRNDNPAAAAAIETVNANLSARADGKGVRFLNVNDRLADKAGRLLDGVSPARPRLAAKGYQVWAAALKPILADVLGPPAKEDPAPPPTGGPSAAGKSGR